MKRKHTDLSHGGPGPRADLLFDRQRVVVKVAGWLGLRATLGVERETAGSSGAAGVVALSASTVPAVVIAVVGAVAGAPGWLVVTLASIVFVLSLAVGVLLVERQRRSTKTRTNTTEVRADAERV